MDLDRPAENASLADRKAKVHGENLKIEEQADGCTMEVLDDQTINNVPDYEEVCICDLGVLSHFFSFDFIVKSDNCYSRN